MGRIISMDQYILLFAAIFLPALSATLCYVVKKNMFRNVTIILNAVLMFIVAASLVHLMIRSNGHLEISLEALNLPVDIDLLLRLADFALLTYISYLGIRMKRPVILILAALQAIPLLVFEFTAHVIEPEIAFTIDYLSIILILLVSVIGPIVTIFAIGYMREHEHHLNLKSSRQPRFFFLLLIFLSAMNALVMTNNLSWMYFFWEVTTLCSFLLISHDGNEQSVKNACRALWINLLGGVAFAGAIIVIHQSSGTLSIIDILKGQPTAGLPGLLPLGLGLLCFAGFTKSAQFPFQSWLLGAMVAPTPVSALLHSSTMVKAGVYLIVRLAPAFIGTTLGTIVAVMGGFTFLVASAIAISQRNGKRVLAYSTIANLGLVICCAGIGSYVALGAAVLLIVFHALSKALLFLCIGTIEQGIGSRDIEDMQGLLRKMPFTTIITVIGMLSMLLPPFGVLLTKWLAIEAAVYLPMVLIMIILGSAFTVVFWAKWIGIVLTMSYHRTKNKMEKLALSIKTALVLLVVGVVATGVDITMLLNVFVTPFLKSSTTHASGVLMGNRGIWLVGSLGEIVGGCSPWYFFLILFLIAFMIPYVIYRTRPERVKPPYLCGENTEDLKGFEFTGPGDQINHVVVHNYYFAGVFEEKNLTLWTNFIAGAIILIMFGVVL